MRRFKSSGQTQRFLSAHGPINNAFRCQRKRLTAQQYRHVRTHAFSIWSEVTDVAKNATRDGWLQPSTEMCGASREHVIRWLNDLECATASA